MDIITLALAKKYVNDTLKGAGALQGETGLSAYEVAVKNGFSGSEEEWLESLKVLPSIGQNGNWIIDGQDTGISAIAPSEEVDLDWGKLGQEG